ncbi:hypothetical protein P9D43_09610 [Neobacillus niacini]|nr:hypothetical protein [Neobacillus niacini]MEC1522273.1 hypothetical protein [Neobacillus niacini]
MALNQLPTIKLSDNSVFLIAISIAAFIFFFTRVERIDGGTSI